jgi:hypothetical protein
VAADQAVEAAAVAVVPIAAGVMAAEMAGTTTILAVHLRLDRERWGVTSASSVAKRGIGCVIAGPSRRRRRHTLCKRKNP